MKTGDENEREKDLKVWRERRMGKEKIKRKKWKKKMKVVKEKDKEY